MTENYNDTYYTHDSMNAILRDYRSFTKQHPDLSLTDYLRLRSMAALDQILDAASDGCLNITFAVNKY